MIFTVFASGSTGNCTLVREGDTGLLIDAGISMRRIKTAVAAEGAELCALGGVLVTHEHSDHVSALEMLTKHTDLPVFAPGVVRYHLLGRVRDEEKIRRIEVGKPFSAGGITVTAFLTPHDTDESVGYVLEASGRRLGYCTDTGHISDEMLANLRGCDAVVIEANHDPAMLRNGPYPADLKRRILSDRGHLSNGESARLACILAEAGAHTVVLAHLSRENNLPSVAWKTVRQALDEAGFAETKLFTAPELGALSVEV